VLLNCCCYYVLARKCDQSRPTMPPAGARTSTSRRGQGNSAAAAIAAASESQAPAMAPTQANPNQSAPTGRNVRARINNYIATPGQVKTYSPLRAAEDFIKSHIESLREGIAPLCLDKGKTFISLQHGTSRKRRPSSAWSRMMTMSPSRPELTLR
jgi:hypothetical protein